MRLRWSQRSKNPSSSNSMNLGRVLGAEVTPPSPNSQPPRRPSWMMARQGSPLRRYPTPTMTSSPSCSRWGPQRESRSRGAKSMRPSWSSTTSVPRMWGTGRRRAISQWIRPARLPRPSRRSQRREWRSVSMSCWPHCARGPCWQNFGPTTVSTTRGSLRGQRIALGVSLWRSKRNSGRQGRRPRRLSSTIRRYILNSKNKLISTKT